MKKLLLITLSCLLLAACNMDVPPIESCMLGNISRSGAVVDKKELSPNQIESLSAWLKALAGEWKFEITDHYPSGMALVLKHRNGRTTQVDIRGDQLWIGHRVRVLSVSERAALQRLLDEKFLIPTFAK